jgi:hydroxymethylglutaryl-CoA lyase
MNRLIKLTDVTLRDGLQSYPKHISIAKKLNMFQHIAKTGINGIEIGSNVSPKVTQMAGLRQMLYGVHQYFSNNKHNMDIKVLVPTAKKLDELLDMPYNQVVDTISVITATTCNFTKKNMNMTIEESLNQIDTMIANANGTNKKFRVYISCCFGCPFTDNSPTELARIANHASYIIQRYLDHSSVNEIIISDTIGEFSFIQLERILQMIESTALFKNKIGLHLHIDKPQIMPIVTHLVESYGIRHLDVAFGDIGGCPTVRASGAKQPINMDAVATVDAIDYSIYWSYFYKTVEHSDAAIANTIVKKILIN